MNTNPSSTPLVIGLAAFGLALVATSIWRHRSSQKRRAAGLTEDDFEIGAGAQDEERDPGGELPEKEIVTSELPVNPPQENEPLRFFLLVLALSIPFWLFGGNRLPIPIKLPVSALAAFNPMIAAAILTYARSGKPGVRQLFQRILDYRKIKNKIWYLPIVLLNPLIMLISYAVMRWAELPLPDPEIQWLMVPVFFLVFFIFAIGEELGWMGYAIDPMQKRWGALKASILLGLAWAFIHLIPDLQNDQTAGWILWHRLGTIAVRILIVWIYNNTGKSVFSAILFHDLNNLSWALFPNYGSHYNPMVTGLITALATGVVMLIWEPKTLVGYRYARAARSSALGSSLGWDEGH